MIRYYFILHFYVGVGRGNFCASLCPHLRSSFTKKVYTCWLNVHVCTDFASLRTATCDHAQRKLVLNHKLLSVSSAPSVSQGPGRIQASRKGCRGEEGKGRGPPGRERRISVPVSAKQESRGNLTCRTRRNLPQIAEQKQNPRSKPRWVPRPETLTPCVLI